MLKTYIAATIAALARSAVIQETYRYCVDDDWVNGERMHDQSYDSCDAYYGKKDRCGKSDLVWFNWWFRSNKLCCACGGGVHLKLADDIVEAKANTKTLVDNARYTLISLATNPDGIV